MLIRRVHFDLTGLPPSPEEVQAFLEDDDPAAYERLVDRLLSRPVPKTVGAAWNAIHKLWQFLDDAQQERLALAAASLPNAALTPPVMLQPLSATSRVMKIGLSSTQYNLMDLSMIAYWTIKFRLLQVPGVANVPMWGERIKMFTVQVDPERARRHGVTLNRIHEVTSETLDFGLVPYSASSKTQTEGFIDTPNQRLSMLHVQPLIEPEDVARVPVQVNDGKTVRIGDVANVVWDTWPLIGDAVINDGPGLMLIVEKLPWGNTLEVTRGVDEALEEMKPGLPDANERALAIAWLRTGASFRAAAYKSSPRKKGDQASAPSLQLGRSTSASNSSSASLWTARS